MAVLIDFSGISMAGILVMQPELVGKTEEEYLRICRHVVMNSVLSIKKKYAKEYGQVIIACDGRDYWRRQYFPEYKANRKKHREESTTDWDLVFKCLNQIRQEIIDYLPYRVILINEAEADDIIAILTKHFRTMVGQMEKVMIVSSDGDMGQLQAYSEVSQYSPILKKMIKLSRKEVVEYINLSTVKGQKKDGIPSIKQANDALVREDKERAPPISQKLLDKFLTEGIDACADEFERKNYERNRILFNFDYIPQRIEDMIINTYYEEMRKFDRMKLYSFFIQNRCNQLLDKIEEF